MLTTQKRPSSLFSMTKSLTIFSCSILVAFVYSAVPRKACGQDLKIVPPTPGAMKMTEYYAQRPSMYTGTANVSVSLHTIDFDGMKLPLSISYNATGVRTNEEAGEVGLGWALNATGVISRTIRGVDDFFPGYNYKYVGYVNNTRAITHVMGNEYNNPSVPQVKQPDPAAGDTSYYAYLLASLPDTQPDVFSYNFFGYSGSFILTQKVSTPVIKVIKLSKDGCRISFDEATLTYTIVTPEGYKGEFTVKEISTTFSSVSDPVNAPTWLAVGNNTCWGENHIDIDAGCK